MRTIITIIFTSKYRVFFLLGMMELTQSCEKLVEVDNPADQITNAIAFQDDVAATSAITGMYVEMIYNQSNFASGSKSSITGLAALSSDEFINFLTTNTSAVQFQENNISPENAELLSLWSSAYKVIYQANSAFESLANSSTLSASVQNQLLGEVLFVRAFCYFNLINLFGEVPLILSTGYQNNSQSKRETSGTIYNHIISDLVKAQGLMDDAYPSNDRARPNKVTATALLSRIYLYKGAWEMAIQQASQIIDNSNYQLEDDLNNVFLSTSREAIWQLMPVDPSVNTWEGRDFIVDALPESSSLRESLVNSFDAGDLRLSNWISNLNIDNDVFYYPFKYKIKLGGPGSSPQVPLLEYSMVFRVAEQYLIRAEAQVHIGMLNEAIADIDKIRGRADLPLIADTEPGISQENLLLTVESERRHELFCEWGHRWFDLKRTKRATSVLEVLKTGWQETDTLYPVPGSEFRKNAFLGNQNSGY